MFRQHLFFLASFALPVLTCAKYGVWRVGCADALLALLAAAVRAIANDAAYPAAPV